MELTPVASSNLAAVGYDYATHEMQVQFHNDTLYAYTVPASVYEGLMRAPSKGRYFWLVVRWRYWPRRLR